MPKQILLADDSATIAKIIQITFAHEDYTVTAVKSGDEAIARARQERPDVVLVDAGLPGKTGYDVCAALRELGLKDVPILILTSNFNPYDEARGQKAGADGCVVKPFETQAMIDRVGNLLGAKSGKIAATAPAAGSNRIESLASPIHEGGVRRTDPQFAAHSTSATGVATTTPITATAPSIATAPTAPAMEAAKGAEDWSDVTVSDQSIKPPDAVRPQDLARAGVPPSMGSARMPTPARSTLMGIPTASPTGQPSYTPVGAAPATSPPAAPTATGSQSRPSIPMPPSKVPVPVAGANEKTILSMEAPVLPAGLGATAKAAASPSSPSSKPPIAGAPLASVTSATSGAHGKPTPPGGVLSAPETHSAGGALAALSKPSVPVPAPFAASPAVPTAAPSATTSKHSAPPAATLSPPAITPVASQPASHTSTPSPAEFPAAPSLAPPHAVSSPGAAASAPSASATSGRGIPKTAPQMPRAPLIPNAPVVPPRNTAEAMARFASRGPEYQALSQMSKEMIEQIVWEVVPDLAEAIIRSEVDRLAKERASAG